MGDIGKLYVGDIGVLIEVETDLDCTLAEPIQLVVLKPDGTTVTWTATLKVGDPSVLQYYTGETDFNVPGHYELLAKCGFGDISGYSGYSGYSGISGYSGHEGVYYGSVTSFRVYPIGD